MIQKASVPAALSVAAFICVRIISKRSKPVPLRLSETLDSGQNHHYHHQHGEEHDQGLRAIGTSSNLEDKLLELEIHIEGLKKRERDTRKRLLRYQEIKEKELMLMEIKNKLMLEKQRGEFLLKEISLVKDESQRMRDLILEYVKLVQQIEDSKNEIRLLEWKAKKMCKRARQRLKVIGKQKLKIEARDNELLSNQEEIQEKDELIQELEGDVSQMKEVIDHLQREKIEISNNFDVAQKSYSLVPKNEIIGVTKEEHEKVVKELEQLQKDREAEASEVTYLKWSNACLRHELTRCHELNHHNDDDDQHADDEGNNTIYCNNNETSMIPIPPSSRGRRRKFIDKVKKWVEGGKTMDGEKDKDNYNSHEIKSCCDKNSVSEEAQHLFVHGRMSCSSV